MIVTTDASSLGWAGTCDGEKIGGRWLYEESLHHINFIELLAAGILSNLSVKPRIICMSK